MEKLYKIFENFSPYDYSDVNEQKNMKRKVRRIIETKFADSLCIHQMENLRLLVIPRSITVAELAEKNFILNANNDIDEKCLMDAATILRKEMISNKPSFSWPPSLSELKADVTSVPHLAEIFFKKLLVLPDSGF